MTKIAIILGGGDGTRAGGPLPKQFRELQGETVLMRSAKAFLDADASTTLFIVLHPSFLEEWDDKVEELERKYGVPVYMVCGGRSRWHSVKNAMLMISEMELAGDALIAIHDGARPLVGKEIIDAGWVAAEAHGAAVPGVDVTDTLREVEADGHSRWVNRSRYKAIQTPQVFKGSVVMDAYSRPYAETFTDDASVAEAAGYPVTIFPGSRRNIKITGPEDFKIAECILSLE